MHSFGQKWAQHPWKWVFWDKNWTRNGVLGGYFDLFVVWLIGRFGRFWPFCSKWGSILWPDLDSSTLKMGILSQRTSKLAKKWSFSKLHWLVCCITYRPFWPFFGHFVLNEVLFCGQMWTQQPWKWVFWVKEHQNWPRNGVLASYIDLFVA